MLRRLWYALPIDGRGFNAPADPDARRLITFATRRRFAMVPRVLLPVLVAAGRLLYCVKAVFAVRFAARKFGFGARESLQQYADACRFGLRPKDSFAWRGTMTERRPLSTQAFWKIQWAVADPDQRALLGDKVATAAALRPFGVLTPEELAIIPAVSVAPKLPDAAAMFVKPHHGSRGRNAFSILRLAPGHYWIDGGPHDEAYVTQRLRDAAVGDALLVQRRVTGIKALADLGTPDGNPPVLRIMTACEPGGEPFLHSASFSMRAIGEARFHPLRDTLRVPVRIATGSLLQGRWLGAPGVRYDVSPWHEAQVAGRLLPGFDKAAAAAVAAARAFPGLPLIGWDVILTDDGPIILEGNSNSDWMIVCWMQEGAPDAVPLLPLMARWAAAIERPTSPAVAPAVPCMP